MQRQNQEQQEIHKFGLSTIIYMRLFYLKFLEKICILIPNWLSAHSLGMKTRPTAPVIYPNSVKTINKKVCPFQFLIQSDEL